MFPKSVPKLKSNPAVEFINSLHHTGDYWGKPFALRPWQERIVRQIFDWRGKPKYEEVFLGIARKQGKTELAAAILLYLVFGTGRKGQRIYSAAGDHSQAALIYNAAANMIRQSQTLSDFSQVYKSTKRIEFNPNDCSYEALSADHALKYGLWPSAVMMDELWVMPNRELYKALMTGFGATIKPFTMLISTAGWDKTSLCWEQWNYARGVRDGLIQNKDYLPILYETDGNADWTSEDVWRAAMPGLDDFCPLKFIRKECEKAQELPAHENSFKQLYLNIWTEQAERWISALAWDACGYQAFPFDATSLEGAYCYAGFDGAVTGDMVCLWLLFPMPDGTFRTAGRAWAPRDGKWRNELRNKDHYLRWHQMGLLRFTAGNAIDEDQVEREIVELYERFPFYLMLADRAYSQRLLNRLYNSSMIPIKAIPQGPVSLNEACVKLEKLVLDRQIHHGSNEILDWNIANASLRRGTTGLVHPDKSAATERIDGLGALINAIAAMVSDPENRAASVYDSPGSLAL